jgi:hypothetical protein
MKKKILISLGAVGMAGLASAAFAASIGVPNGNAGQGTSVNEGYSVGTIFYNGQWVEESTDSTTDVTDFGFVLRKDQDGTGTSSVTNANTTVYSQLISSSGSPYWILCSIGSEPQAGFVTCEAQGEQQEPIADIVGVNIVAYDKQ